MDCHQFYNRLCGRAGFTVAEVQRLLGVFPAQALVDHLLASTPYIAIPRDDPAGKDSGETLLLDAARAVTEAAAILRAVDESLQDERLCHHDRRRVREEVVDAERALATLRHHLEALPVRTTPADPL